MNEKILLINIHSSRNMGDAALLKVTLQQLHENFPGAEITLCMDDPDSHTGAEKSINSIFSWVYPFRRDNKAGWKYSRLVYLLPATLIPLLSQKFLGVRINVLTPARVREITDAYLEADLVISKPGGFLYSSGRGISLLVAMYSLIYAHWAGKPVYIFPQSIGPLNHKWEYRLMRMLLNRMRIVMIREPASLVLVNKLSLEHNNVHLIPDLAFGLIDEGPEAGENWLTKNGIDPHSDMPLLGMTIINWGGQNQAFSLQDQYENACVIAIRSFANKYSGRVILFPQVYGPLVSQDDRIPAHRVAEKSGIPSDVVKVVDEPIHAELLKSIYGWMDIFIGTRMHSNIFALSKGVPVIAIGYLHKTEGIARMAGVEKWVIDIRDMDGKILQDRLSELWSERQEWRDRIQRKIPLLIDEAAHAGKIAADDFYHTWIAANNG